MTRRMIFNSRGPIAEINEHVRRTGLKLLASAPTRLQQTINRIWTEPKLAESLLEWLRAQRRP